jgi:hypothetical protein
LELIPNTVFLEDDLPDWFVSDYVHWLDFDTGIIEFRPLENPWLDASEQVWKVNFSTEFEAKIVSSTLQLVPSAHPLCRNIHSILHTLESANHVLVFLDEHRKIQIELRRYGLKFFIDNEGRLISKDYDAIVHPDQDLGCLYGLHNKLVLCPSTEQFSAHRYVLIPFGPVTIAKYQSHVVVSIDHDAKREMQHFKYRCDNYLRVIQSPGDRLSALFLAYLHAVTAFVLPDPTLSLDIPEQLQRYEISASRL